MASTTHPDLLPQIKVPTPQTRSPARPRVWQSVSIGPNEPRQFQERVRHRAGGARQPQEPPFTPRSGARKSADEPLRGGRPPASHFDGKHHETRSGSSPDEFRVSPFLAKLYHAGLHLSWLCHRSASAHQCRVQRQLDSPIQWQPIHSHFESAFVGCDGCVEVQVSHEHVGAHPTSCFSADSCHNAPQWEPPSAQAAR